MKAKQHEQQQKQKIPKKQSKIKTDFKNLGYVLRENFIFFIFATKYVKQRGRAHFLQS